MIYRAFCYSDYGMMRFCVEEAVFVEAFSICLAEQKMIQLLSEIWNVPKYTIILTHLKSEMDLLSDTVDSDSYLDCRLLECGQENLQPLYLNPDEALLLLQPRLRERIKKSSLLIGKKFSLQKEEK